MRITELQPGMKCYRYGRTPVEVLKVVLSNADAGVHYPYAIVQDEEGNQYDITASCLAAASEVEEREQQKQRRQEEVERTRLELVEYLPSIQASTTYASHGQAMMDVALDQEDCLKLLAAYQATVPKRLPASYPIHEPECRKVAILLAQKVRRTVGDGYCSKWSFPREWGEDKQLLMHLSLMDESLTEARRKLAGDSSPASALEQLFAPSV
jgi:hypothetical protein